MLMLDLVGVSDPYVIVNLGNQSIQSKIIKNSVNPTWNQFLNIPEVFLYGTIEDIKRNPPEIIVNIYDSDPFNVSIILLHIERNAKNF